MNNPLRLSACLLVLLGASACSVESRDTGEDLGQTSEAVSDVCPTKIVKGVDVASFQHPGGAAINWTKVAMAEKFVIVKATEKNNYVNSYYANDVVKARAAGLVVGSYHFLAPSSQTGVSGATQAAYFLAHSSIKAGDLPPMLDVETSSSYSNVLPSVADVTGWLNAVEASVGRKPIVYIGYYTIGSIGTPTALKKYPINIPSYGQCPSFPDSYPIDNLIMWQHTSTANISGITGGGVDEDEFYGDLAAFNAFVAGPQTASSGSLDHADCDGVSGWGFDPTQKDQAQDIDVSFNAVVGDAKATTVRASADQSRMDLCMSIGSCDHAFSMRAPRSLLDGRSHVVHANHVDAGGKDAGELDASPKTLQCAVLDLPTNTVKRLVNDPTTLTAWGFDAFTDVAPIAQAEIDAEPSGADIDPTPTCVKADDGTAAVWVIDQGVRRHVVDGASEAAWRLTPTITAAAEVDAHPIGADWPATPDLIQGNGTEVYVLDTPTATSSAPPAAGTGGGGSGATSDPKDHTGCSIASGEASEPGGAALAWASIASAIGLLVIRSRTRRFRLISQNAMVVSVATSPSRARHIGGRSRVLV